MQRQILNAEQFVQYLQNKLIVCLEDNLEIIAKHHEQHGHDNDQAVAANKGICSFSAYWLKVLYNHLHADHHTEPFHNMFSDKTMQELADFAISEMPFDINKHERT